MMLLIVIAAMGMMIVLQQRHAARREAELTAEIIAYRSVTTGQKLEIMMAQKQAILAAMNGVDEQADAKRRQASKGGK
jgi:hypothetical protein